MAVDVDTSAKVSAAEAFRPEETHFLFGSLRWSGLFICRLRAAGWAVLAGTQARDGSGVRKENART